MELKHYLLLARRWWWIVLLMALLGAGGGFGVTFIRPPVYEASTTVLINQAPGSLPDVEAVLSGQRVAATYAELMHQRPILEQVITNLSLTTDPQDLEERITVTPVRDTNLLVLNVRDSDPNRAAAIADEIVRVFVQQNVEYQASRYTDTIQTLETEMANVQADIAGIEQALEHLVGATSSAELEEKRRLEALLSQNRQNYAMLVQSYEDIRLTQAQTTDQISVIETALPGEKLTNPLLNAVLGAIVGVMAAVGMIFLVEVLRETVQSDDQIEELTGAPTLGIIGQMRTNGQGSLITVSKPRSPIAEAYRVLRANVEFSAADHPVRTMVVTSSGPAEGKSTTAANLAVAFAQSGKRVILVDSDLRRPALHKYFKTPNHRGLTTALLQERGINLGDHLVATGVDNLYLMPSGPLPPNPADMLGSRRMQWLIDELKGQVDLVIFDTPPLLAVADASLLARHCDATILIVLADSTRSQVLRRATEQIVQTGSHLIGVVLNRVSSRSESYYYQSHYYSQER